MPRDSNGAIKSRTVTFTKNHGIQADIQVIISATDTDRALAVARAALHSVADQKPGAGNVTVA